MTARESLINELRDHALIVGEVTLTSGAVAQYYVDAKRAILLPAGFRALGELVAEQARLLGATAVGGMTMGADPVACAALAGGADVKAFFVRKEAKQHGLSRRVEGPLLDATTAAWSSRTSSRRADRRCARSRRCRTRAATIVGVVSVLDRLAGGGERIEAAAGAPYVALATIDDVHPDRPDR